MAWPAKAWLSGQLPLFEPDCIGISVLLVFMLDTFAMVSICLRSLCSAIAAVAVVLGPVWAQQLPIPGRGSDIAILDVNNDLQPDIVHLDSLLRSLVIVLNETPCPATLTTRGSDGPGTGGFTPRLRLEGCAGPSGTTILTLDHGLTGVPSWLYFGPAATDIDFGLGCRLFVDPVGTGLLPINLSGAAAPGQGRWEIILNWPASIAPGFSLALQGVSSDPAAVAGLSSTNGLLLTIP